MNARGQVLSAKLGVMSIDTHPFVQGAIVTIVGGTVSEATGGKFANGAVTSAMSFAFANMGGGSGEPSNEEVMQMSDAEFAAWMDARVNLEFDPSTAIAVNGLSRGLDALHMEFVQGNITAEEYYAFERGADDGATIGLSMVATGPVGGPVRSVSLAARSLGANPFRGKSAEQIITMLRNRGFIPRGPNPASGAGTYVNPKTGRGYHLDLWHQPGKAPHVGVNRPRSHRHMFNDRDYFID